MFIVTWAVMRRSARVVGWASREKEEPDVAAAASPGPKVDGPVMTALLAVRTM